MDVIAPDIETATFLGSVPAQIQYPAAGTYALEMPEVEFIHKVSSNRIVHTIEFPKQRPAP